MPTATMRAAVLAALLAACTAAPAPEPTPPPTPSPPAAVTPLEDGGGIDVGLVGAPPGSGIASLRSAVLEAAAVEVARRDGVRDVRVLDAPDETARGELLGLLADQGTDVVCTVGPAGVDDVVVLADRHPTVRFCLLGAALPVSRANAVGVRWNDAETALLAGAAAALVEPEIVLVVQADTDPQPLLAAATVGARRVRPDARVVAVGADREPPARARRALVPVGGPELVAATVAAAEQRGGSVVGWAVEPRTVLGENGGGEVVLATIVQDLDAALAAVLSAADSPAVFGIAEGAVHATAGPAPLGDAVVAQVGTLADQVAGGRTADTAG